MFSNQSPWSSLEPLFLENFQPQCRIAQCPGDEKIISDSCSFSEEKPSLFSFSQKADVDDDFLRERSISSDQIDMKLLRPFF